MTQPVELQGTKLQDAMLQRSKLAESELQQSKPPRAGRFDAPWYAAEQLTDRANAASLFPVLPNQQTQNWLLNIESLTERLTQCCTEFTVDVLSQISTEPQSDELTLIQQPEQSEAVVREVVLRGDSHPWVFARSVFPEALTQDVLNDIGDQPLGKLLFNDPRFQRQPFMVSVFQADAEFVAHLLALGVVSVAQLAMHFEQHQGIWARRSVFTYTSGNKNATKQTSPSTHHILVSEVFLPGAPAYV